MASVGYLEHTSPIFKRFKLLKVEDIYNFQLGTYMFHARARGEYNTPSNYQTRWADDAYANRHLFTTTQHAISYTGPKLWNSLPPHIRSIESFRCFKSSLRKHFLNKY